MKWASLFIANFLGVFNDNFLKHLAVFTGVTWIAKEHHSLVISLASAMLVIPYLLFSPYAGRLSRRYSKVLVTRWAKFAEIPIMTIAGIGFLLQSLPIVIISIFLMGLQSALYSPSKYGLIRDIGGLDGISFGTGILEMLTFLGVLFATVLASTISDNFNIRTVGFIFFIVSLGGYISSLFLKANEPPVDLAKDSINPLRFLIDSFRYAQTIKGLNPVVFAASFFWLIVALIQLNLIVYGPKILHLTNTQTGYIMAIAGLGVAIGCYLSGVLSNHKVEMRFVVIGGIGLLSSVLLISLFSPRVYIFTFLVFIAALFSGLYKIPLGAWMQEHVPGRMLGEIIAYANLMDFIFILISSALFGILDVNVGPTGVFIAISILTFTMLLFVLLKLPGIKLPWKR